MPGVAVDVLNLKAIEIKVLKHIKIELENLSLE